MTAVGDYFDTIAAGYDSFALRAMPRYEEMLREIYEVFDPPPVTEVAVAGRATESADADR